MTDPNYNPQQYPDTGQNRQQYQQPQYGQTQQQTYQQPQYTQPQTNPYAANQQYAQYQYGQQPYVNPQPADTGSFGWAVLGFFFPIVGLILFLVWKSEKPVSAKQAGMGALASVISTVVLWILLIVFAAMIGSAVTY